MEEKNLWGKIRTFLIFAGPAALAFAAVVIIPFIYGLGLSFTDWNGLSSSFNFVGFSNYGKVFQDGEFWNALWLTIKYVICSVILINLVAFCLAYFLTSGVRGQNFLRAGFFTPNLIGGIVLGFIWQFIFNRVLTQVDMGIFSESWLSSPVKAFWAMVIVTVWQYSGYMMIIYVSGFMSIPQDIKEAASIDGCTGWQRTRHIVLPLMVPSFVICLFLSLQRCFMVYDVNLSFTEGGPYGSTVMAAMYVYRKAFLSKEFGVGQAEALILFLVVAVIIITQTMLGKRKEVEA